MKARFLLLLTFLVCLGLSYQNEASAQVQPVGTVIGNQTVVNIPIAPPGYPTAQALVYYPDDYFKPENATKRYPLYVFLHGAGEGSTDNITEVTNTSLPQLIRQGLKPYNVDPATGDTIKWLIVSPHCAYCGANYSYPQLQYTIPSLFTTYRVDTSCVWIGGLSAGARGTWSVVMGLNVGDTALGKRITGIMPMANGGYDNYISTLAPNLDTIATRGLATLYVIGDQDPGYNAIGFFAYQALMKTFSKPGRYFDKVIIGGTHSANVWNTPYPLTARNWSTTQNSWEQMWGFRKTAAAATAPAVTPPTVSAGTAQAITLPTSTVTLTGTATPAGATTIDSWAWTQTGGASATIGTASNASTSITGLTTAGTYTFKLTVTASDGGVSTSTVTVTVNPAPAATPPTVSAGTDQAITLPTSATSLAGSATPVGSTTISTYAWTQTAGATATIGTASSATTSITGLTTAGTYTFKLTATASDGGSASATVNVVVNAAAAPAAPTVSAGSDQVITLPTSTATLTGTATPAGSTTISTYAWTQTGGTTASIADASSPSTAITGLTTAGVYTFQLKVTASDGGSATSTVKITVNAAAAPVPPTVSAGADIAITLPTSTVTLTGTATPGGSTTITGYTWSQTGGASATIASNSTLSTAITGLTSAGTYTFQLKVAQSDGSSATATVTVTVYAAPAGGGTICTKVALTEYQAGWLFSDGKARSFIWNNSTGHVEFTAFQIGGRKAVDISTGFNRITILDDQGYVWLNDGGKNTAVRWDVDATGAAANGFTSIYGYFYTYLGIRSDGTIWYWGGDDYKLYGGTAIANPMKINQPAGVKFVKIATGSSIVGLTSTGDVYMWDKGNVNYYKVNLPRPASDIAASHMAWFMAVVPDNIAVSTMGYPYAWGSESRYWGGNGTGAAASAPVSLKAMWNMTVPIKEIAANQNTLHYIDANGDLYGIGDNPNGEVGNGTELVNHAEKYPTPYAWSWIKYENLTGAPPIQISPGTKFKKLFGGNTFVFYKYALDVNDSLYFWGRNKSFVGGDGVVNNQESTYPNALDILKPTMRTPMGVKPTQTVGFNFTPYTLKCPAKQNIITTSATLTATSTSSKLVASGFPNYGYTIVKYQWTQVSGPACTISTPNALTTNVTGLTSGTYIFTIQTTDNNTGTISANDTIVVNAAAPGVPVANAGNDITITLPTSSTTLTGSGAENGGTITGYKWTQTAGPVTATIAASTSATTGISGLTTAGVYKFLLTVTDAAGATATATVTVTVNPAVVPGAPVANAGSDQTITLPASSVSVTGSGSETNGTITGYKWTQLSGPVTGTITAPTSASTSFTGLTTAGVYTFQLTVTDALGVTATDVITINVKAAVVVGNPIAIAGSDQTITLPTNTATLSGSGSETNGTITGYKWTQLSGPNTANIISPLTAGATVNGLIEGTYIFQLTVTDALGKTATDVTTITVNPAVATPGNPVVVTSADIVISLPTSTANLVASASELNGTITGYKWAQISGPATATLATPLVTATAVSGLTTAGVYNFQITVTDAAGKTATDVIKVTVNPAPAQPTPVVDAGANQTLTLPTSSTTLTGVASETNGSITGYAWSQISGPATSTIAAPASATTGISGLVAGVYVFQLTVTDANGVTASDVVKVTVNSVAVNQSPIANAGPDQNLSSITQVSLDGSASYDPDGTIATYAWVQTSGAGGVTITGAATATPVVYGLEAGVYTFHLTVTDNQGASATATVNITITVTANQGPVAVVGNDTTIIFPGQTTALLNGSASYDPNGSIISYDWVQLSGPSAALIADNSSNVSAVGAMIIGDYVFQLTVTDNQGAKATATMRVHVLDDLKHTGFVKIYPNPVLAGQQFTVEGLTDSASMVKFSIYDIGGRLVRVVVLDSQFSQFKQQIPTAGMPRGVYVLQVLMGTAAKPQTFKFIVD